MIVLTEVRRKVFCVFPGDSFNLSVRGGDGEETIITEEITVTKVIDFIASFRFAMEDGKCLGFHLSGFFGNSKELPQEIRDAKRLKDLTELQHKNFIASVGTAGR
jgi:hypothetical protein